MSKKIAETPLRRSELISPMGVGSISTNSDGVNMMPGALDLWYKNSSNTREEEYIFNEKRLEKILNVEEFRLPPDYRAPFNQYSQTSVNIGNEIPMLRFPTWHYCNSCRFMSKKSYADPENKISCTNCSKKNSRLIQVPLVIACSAGHIDDFPWNEWLHKSVNPNCMGPIKYQSTGGPTLSSMKLKCTKCDLERTMSGVTTSTENVKSSLSTKLDSSGKKFNCTGRKHWYGTKESAHEECQETPYAILKNSSNLYFANVINALFLPGDRSAELKGVFDVLLREDVQKETKYLIEFSSATEESIPSALLYKFSDLFKDANESMIREARKLMSLNEEEDIDYENINLKLKKEEYEVLLNELLDSEHLKIVKEYDSLEDNFLLKSLGINKVNLVPTLRDTRVLYGFNRLKVDAGLDQTSIDKGKKLLFKDFKNQETSWLPGYKVYGEGIFIEFDNNLLSAWDKKVKGSKRFKQMEGRIQRSNETRNYSGPTITPSFVMLHTLSHLLIQELVFECGYSTSALRERLYISNENGFEMNGFMIYTASGDSEGTMGGLVRLGEKGKLERLLKRAIEKSQWCSSDPVCNEIGITSGQGVNYMNGAACHNCSYLPETSCEEFNQFLDRGLVEIYTEENLGFFKFLKDLEQSRME